VGSATGGDTLTIRGSKFVSGMSVKIGGQDCTSVSVISSSEITCTVPVLPGAAKNTVDVQLKGVTTSSLPNAYSSVLVLGQSVANEIRQFANGFNTPFDVASCGGKLFVLDTNNNRVLIWNSVPSGPTYPLPDVVVGQPNLNSGTANNGGIGASTLSSPFGLTCSGSKLLVSDSSNRRVLIWNTIPSANFQAADVVLGQPDFVSNTSNNGGRSASSLSTPNDLEVGPDGHLYVVDGSNHRVLVWNSIPSTNMAAADLVLGQTNFTNGTAATSQTRLNAPLGVTMVGNRVLVSDQSHRVMVWNSSPTTNGQAADLVIGQTTFTATTSGLAANRLNRPFFMASDGAKLFVGDENNNRVLIWNTFPTVNGQAADVVLGQPNFTSNTANNGGIGAGTLSDALGVAVISVGGVNRLFAVDKANNRILVWNTLPTSNQQVADSVIGQSTFTSVGTGGVAISGTAFLTPRDIAYNGQQFAVCDRTNNRVLLWNSMPTSSLQEPDVVIGQPSSSTTTANNGGLSAKSLSGPRGVWLEAAKLIVSDGNNRVLIWNSIPTSNFQAADLVLGQPGFTTSTANNGGVSASSLNIPFGATVAGGKLFVPDQGNNRVLFWNHIPTVSTTAADGVLGQPDMVSNTANNGGLSGATMKTPMSVAYNGTMFAVSEAQNARVLIWNGLPSSSSAAAIVLGQPDFATSVLNNGTGAQGFSSPFGIGFTSDSLLVGDSAKHRILQFALSGLSNFSSATAVLGQSDFTTGVANQGGVSMTSLNSIEGVRVLNGFRFYADRDNMRVVISPE
jgi:hypothetical protein